MQVRNLIGKKKIDHFHQDSKNGFQEDAQLKARFVMPEIHKNLSSFDNNLQRS
jgi:hypothetical protein